MQSKLILPAAALFLMTAAPACAALLYAPATDHPGLILVEEDTGVRNVFMFFLGLLFMIAIIGILSEPSSSSSTDTQSESDELIPLETPEHFDQQAARTRARSRMLDADAMLAESQLRASLKQDELREFESFLREKNSSGRRK